MEAKVGQIGEWGVGVGRREQRGVTEVQYGCWVKCEEEAGRVKAASEWAGFYKPSKSILDFTLK